MSLITEQIGMLRDVAQAYSRNGLNKILNEAADTIEELSAKIARQNMERSSQYYHSDWILADDRLPEEKGEYLVTYHPCYWDDVSPEIKAGIDNFRGKTTWAKKKYQHIIAWKPLPKPYIPTED